MVNRRGFLKTTGTVAGTAAASLMGATVARASGPELDADRIGVLADLTHCIGCRRCEWACAEQNGFPHGPPETFDDQSIFDEKRRPDAERYTVINRYDPLPGRDQPLDVKVNCLHCEHPACVSACIVGALQKDPRGPVTYDADKCIGCRYCMIACPFQIPAYEYDNALTPRIMKCTMCAERTLERGEPPACVAICPREALVFARRSDLLELAHERIRKAPERYYPHVFGEQDGGGTSWLMLADRSFQEIDLPALGSHSPAETTERIQHGIFRGFSGPLMVFALLVVLMKSTSGADPATPEEEGDV